MTINTIFCKVLDVDIVYLELQNGSQDGDSNEREENPGSEAGWIIAVIHCMQEE